MVVGPHERSRSFFGNLTPLSAELLSEPVVVLCSFNSIMLTYINLNKDNFEFEIKVTSDALFLYLFCLSCANHDLIKKLTC